MPLIVKGKLRPSARQYVQSSVYPSVQCPSIHLSIRPSVYPSICPSVIRTSVRLSVYPSVYPSFRRHPTSLPPSLPAGRESHGALAGSCERLVDGLKADLPRGSLVEPPLLKRLINRRYGHVTGGGQRKAGGIFRVVAVLPFWTQLW